MTRSTKTSATPLPCGAASATPLRTCASCGRHLPLADFYYLPARGVYDCYCRACRKLRNLQSRERAAGAATVQALHPHALITTEADPVRRLLLIRQARCLVRESMERKRRRDRRDDDDRPQACPAH